MPPRVDNAHSKDDANVGADAYAVSKADADGDADSFSTAPLAPNVASTLAEPAGADLPTAAKSSKPAELVGQVEPEQVSTKDSGNASNVLIIKEKKAVGSVSWLTYFR